ncbi:MAG: transposase [Candidatus Aenigmarchaeota archaeon]|nr:transposase [Candidatus Aenigmarchaeota archaeon]
MRSKFIGFPIIVYGNCGLYTLHFGSGHLWNHSYYVDSVGDNTYGILEGYVRNQ